MNIEDWPMGDDAQSKGTWGTCLLSRFVQSPLDAGETAMI
jgi:hypothetical protein